jgi:hypothetical protein
VNVVVALTPCDCPFIATASGGDDDPFVIVLSCIPVLLSFRSIAQIGIAHPSRSGRLELAGDTADVLGQFAFPSRENATVSQSLAEIFD